MDNTDQIQLAQEVRRIEGTVTTHMETFVVDRLTRKFNDLEGSYNAKIGLMMKNLEAMTKEAEKAVETAKPVRNRNVSGVVLKGLQHAETATLLKLLQAKLHPLLVGPAGSGKSMGAQLCAEAMNLDFYVQSVGAQTSMSQIFGFMDANTNYRPTHFRTAYEHGGVFCMDEIDAGNANVLVGINSALANGLCAFPDAIINVHPDFRFIATANTIGRGATAKYTGRNRLDEATLDRFVAVHWDYDTALETIIGGSSPAEVKWREFVWRVRDYVDKNQIQIVISTRMITKGRDMLPYFTEEEILKHLMFSQISQDHHDAIKKLWS